MTRWSTIVFPLVALFGAGALAGCGALDVSDPTAVEERELNSANGAVLLYGNALRQMNNTIGQWAGKTGTVADEFFYVAAPYFAVGTDPNELIDRREGELYQDRSEYYALSDFEYWPRVRTAATAAMPRLRQYFTDTAYLGEMFAVRGFATIMLAESYCPGFPIHELHGLEPVYGPPVTTAEAFERALADLDSAVSYAADSARVLNFARVARARALLGLGRFTEAGAAVAGVADDYEYLAEFAAGTNGNSMGFGASYGRSVANREGGEGLDFVDAADPRVPTAPTGIASDSVTQMYKSTKYADQFTPIVLASGLEARLIEAEAALHGGPGDWRDILNHAREMRSGLGLSELQDPGTPEARVDLVFRERALWLYATSHRLGDLRRLIAYYDRDAESVFPSGSYRGIGTYGVATSISFSPKRESAFNPAVTGCTSW